MTFSKAKIFHKRWQFIKNNISLYTMFQKPHFKITFQKIQFTNIKMSQNLNVMFYEMSCFAQWYSAKCFSVLLNFFELKMH